MGKWDQLNAACRSFPILTWLESQGIRGRGGGDHIRINCPHCRGWKTLGIHTETKVCNCFKCTEGGYAGGSWKGKGNLVDLLVLVGGMTRGQAIKLILKSAGLPDLPHHSEEHDDTPSLVPPESIPITEAHPDHPARKRLRERGLERLEPTIRICTTGKYHDRWVLPVWMHGEYLGYEAKGWYKMRPPSLFPEWLKTSEILYTTPNWDSSLDWAVLTESIFDAETLGMNTIGLFGSKIRDGQVCRLLEMRKTGLRRLIWFLDEDAWKKQRYSILRKTRAMFSNYIINGLPVGEDPNSLGTARCWDLVSKAVLVGGTVDLLQKM